LNAIYLREKDFLKSLSLDEMASSGISNRRPEGRGALPLVAAHALAPVGRCRRESAVGFLDQPAIGFDDAKRVVVGVVDGRQWRAFTLGADELERPSHQFQ
jgi:hypothetical protein